MAAARKVAQEKTWEFLEGARPTAVHTFKHPVVIMADPVSSNPAITLQMLLEHPNTYAQQCAPWAQEVADKADTTEQITFVLRTQDAVQQAAAKPTQGTDLAATPAAPPLLLGKFIPIYCFIFQN